MKKQITLTLATLVLIFTLPSPLKAELIDEVSHFQDKLDALINDAINERGDKIGLELLNLTLLKFEKEATRGIKKQKKEIQRLQYELNDLNDDISGNDSFLSEQKEYLISKIAKAEKKIEGYTAILDKVNNWRAQIFQRVMQPSIPAQ